ncbi:lysophospholipid acyltransferase LPCAT4 [Osmerus mordax]|uniref:lysophospholipid acyltransferase LPCAT4 n=1 Tax=Osmerus mordax TaxID=8014 RepID=UPI00350F3CE8
MERRYSHSATPDCPHPFVHKLKLTTAQQIRGIVQGCFLFPIRMTLTALIFLIMWPFARLRFAGLSEEERAKPVSGWRRWLFHPIISLLSRAAFFSLGFLWIKVKGRRAGLKEAPVLAVAPHSGFLDMLVLCPTQLPTVVSRSENAGLPVIGALLEFNQSVIVSRKDPESRRKCVTHLKERLTSNGHWPQMLMFPEGTTTNGSVLIKFKPGAFLAGVPVQPVLLRYPNRLDTTRWTYKGTSWIAALWYTTSQLYTNVTVEYMPVYTPSQEEKADPNLYADNVQKLMAKALDLPATDYVMEGRVPVNKLGGISLPLEPPARQTLSLLYKNGFRAADVESALVRMIDRCQSGHGWMVGKDELPSLLGLTDRPTAAKIYSLYSKDEEVDVRQIYLSVAAISGLVGLKSLLHTAVTMFDCDGVGSLSAVELSDLMGALVGIPQHNSTALYTELAWGGRPTEEDLLRVLTSHPTYQRLLNEYLQPEEAGPVTSSLTNGEPRGSKNNNNGAVLTNKKAD